MQNNSKQGPSVCKLGTRQTVHVGVKPFIMEALIIVI